MCGHARARCVFSSCGLRCRAPLPGHWRRLLVLHQALDIGTFAAHFRFDGTNQRLVTMAIRPGFADKEPKIAFYEFDTKWNVLHVSGCARASAASTCCFV